MSRLLVVDDDIQMLSALETALRRKGHLVETASNGIEAAAKLDNTNVQAVITDLKMPGMDGLELLQHVRGTNPGTSGGGALGFRHGGHGGRSHQGRRQRLSGEAVLAGRS